MKYRPFRYQTSFPIKIITPTGLQQVQVLDVHQHGARIGGIADVTRGDKLRLNLLSHSVIGVVQWSRPGCCGLAFRPPLTDDQLDILRKRNDSRGKVRHNTIGFAQYEMR